MRVPCTARRSNQSILKEISPEYSLERLFLKLKLQVVLKLKLQVVPEAEAPGGTLATLFEELTHWKQPGCWEILKAGGEGDNRG